MSKKLRYTTPEGALGAPKQEVQKQEVQQQPEAEPPREPKEDPDTLRSHSYARVIDLICEGEIEGLVDHGGNTIEHAADFGKGVYLDETPLLNGNGKPNFQGIRIGLQYGTQDQFALAGFGRAEDVVYSGQEVKHAFPVVVGITNSEAEVIEVAIRFPSLLSQDKATGDIHGSKVMMRIDTDLNSSGTWALGDEFLTWGKASSPYVRTMTVKLPQGSTAGSNNWQIRVVRIEPDSANLNVQNSSFLDFITVITRNRFAYPNSCIVAGEIDARGFTNIPRRAFHVRGLRIKVPNNYFPASKDNPATYNRDPLTGEPFMVGDEPANLVWNGGFRIAWTNNPAWCLYDLLTTRRYGLGDYITEARVDKWSLYSAAQYCDELVDDGFGDLEPRFSCNIYIQGREEAWRVIQDMTSVLRGMAYFANGTVVVAQDRPKIAVATFTNANVLGGEFSRQGTAKKNRHTSASVRWNDPSDFFRPKYEYVDDPEGIAKYGVNETEIAAFACTSRGQAHRVGKWTLASELNETGIVTFTAGVEGAYLRPGDVIKVLDNDRAGTQQGGRVLAIAGDRMSVTLDRQVLLATTINELTIVRPRAFLHLDEVTNSTDGPATRTPQLDVRTLTNAAGTTDLLTFAVPLADEVVVGAVWVLKTESVAPELYRVVTVEETSDGRYNVQGLEYFEGKFDAVELGLELEIPDVSDLPRPTQNVPTVNRLTLTRSATVTPEGITKQITVSWEEPPDVLVESYRVQVRRPDLAENWTVHEQTAAHASTINYTLPGTYEVGVIAISMSGAQSEVLTQQIVIPDANPIDLYAVTGLQLFGQGNDVVFTGQNAKFEWRLNSPRGAQEVGDDATHGASSGQPDPYFLDYEIKILALDGELLLTESTLDTTWTLTMEKNAELNRGPHNQFTIQVRGRDRFGSPTAPAVLTVVNPAPNPPYSVEVQAAWRMIYLSWRNPDDLDFDFVEILESSTGVLADADVIAIARGTTWAKTDAEAGRSLKYWLRAVDTFGNRSTLAPPAGLLALTTTIPPTDIANFAIDATKMFTNTIVLMGDVWQSNTPGAGQISWNAHRVVFRGTIYEIPASFSGLRYVWWRGPTFTPDGALTSAGEIRYRLSDVHPKDAGLMLENDFIIATNAENLGIFDLAWRGFANAVIGSAWIASAAITDAQIRNVSADKIVAGSIFGQTLQVGAGAGRIQTLTLGAGGTGYFYDPDVTFVGGGGTGATAKVTVTAGAVTAITLLNRGTGYATAPTVRITGGGGTGATATATTDFGVVGNFQSTNYATGVAGWRLDSLGNLEANNAVLRGNLALGAGFFNADFPSRIFQARPEMECPIGNFTVSWNGGATGNKNLQTLSETSTGPVVFHTRRLNFWYGQLIAAPWNDTALGADQSVPNPAAAALFFGVNMPDYVYTHAGHPTRTVTYFARPRRLAFDGDNVFTIEVFVKTAGMFSVWYQIADFPVWTDGGGKTQSMGNRRGTNAAPNNDGLTWIWLGTVALNPNNALTSGGMAIRRKINVPQTKCILFGIAPINADGTRTNDALWILRNGYLKVTAENVGNILVTDDPADDTTEEP